MAFSFLPREDDYFVFFSQMTERIQEAADILGEMVQSNSPNVEDYAKRRCCRDATGSRLDVYG